MSHFEQFLWGFLGSLAAEVPALTRARHSYKGFPRQFRDAPYWAARLLIAIVAGLLAVAAQAQTALLAMELGVVTPMVIDGWSRRATGLDGVKEPQRQSQ